MGLIWRGRVVKRFLRRGRRERCLSAEGTPQQCHNNVYSLKYVEPKSSQKVGPDLGKGANPFGDVEGNLPHEANCPHPQNLSWLHELRSLLRARPLYVPSKTNNKTTQLNTTAHQTHHTSHTSPPVTQSNHSPPLLPTSQLISPSSPRTTAAVHSTETCTTHTHHMHCTFHTKQQTFD